MCEHVIVFVHTMQASRQRGNLRTSATAGSNSPGKKEGLQEWCSRQGRESENWVDILWYCRQHPAEHTVLRGKVRCTCEVSFTSVAARTGNWSDAYYWNICSLGKCMLASAWVHVLPCSEMWQLCHGSRELLTRRKETKWPSRACSLQAILNLMLTKSSREINFWIRPLSYHAQKWCCVVQYLEEACVRRAPCMRRIRAAQSRTYFCISSLNKEFWS